MPDFEAAAQLRQLHVAEDLGQALVKDFDEVGQLASASCIIKAGGLFICYPET